MSQKFDIKKLLRPQIFFILYLAYCLSLNALLHVCTFLIDLIYRRFILRCFQNILHKDVMGFIAVCQAASCIVISFQQLRTVRVKITSYPCATDDIERLP